MDPFDIFWESKNYDCACELADESHAYAVKAEGIAHSVKTNDTLACYLDEAERVYSEASEISKEIADDVYGYLLKIREINDKVELNRSRAEKAAATAREAADEIKDLRGELGKEERLRKQKMAEESANFKEACRLAVNTKSNADWAAHSAKKAKEKASSAKYMLEQVKMLKSEAENISKEAADRAHTALRDAEDFDARARKAAERAKRAAKQAELMAKNSEGFYWIAREEDEDEDDEEYYINED